jgi:hypothetical protein
MEVRRFYRFGTNGERCVSAFDFDRVAAERDALQIRLNSVEEENDRLRQDCIAMRAVIDETGCSFEEIGDMYADAALNDRRYRLLRDRMCVDDFPAKHPEWSTPSEMESIRIDRLCDAALELEKQP